jgi:gamma-glutamyl hercynylcysteine S-oxide synthase
MSAVLNLEISSAHLFRNADAKGLASSLTEARAALQSAFSLYETALAEHNFSVPQVPVVNLPLWEFGHVAWFQERWLLRNTGLDRGVLCDPRAQLEASMLQEADELYDSSAVNHSTRWSLPLPDLNATRAYADKVLAQSLERLNASKTDSESHYLFWLCAAHEFMHAEAFSYMANTLQLAGAASFAQAMFVGSPLIYGVSSFPCERLRFGFDNESAEQTKEVRLVDAKAVELDRLPVNWQMLQEFRSSPSYFDDKYWPGTAKAWLHAETRTPYSGERISKAKPLNPGHDASSAAHVSYWEAQAWCLWHGRALPTEAQWLAAVAADDLPWGHVWEWTRTEFAPFSGFVAHPYEDYSQPWFNKGFRVLKGGSIYTHARMKHPLYRNFFLPNRDDVCTGFRSCRVAI